MSGWSIPIERIAAQMNERVETVAKKITLDLFRNVVEKSPVDTGRFKGNWNVSYAVPNMSVGGRQDKTPKGEVDGSSLAMLQRVNGFPVGGISYLSNGLAYARRLEYGWSGQAPSGMVRLSVREFDAYVQRALA